MGNSSIGDKEVSWKALDLSVYGTVTGPVDRDVHQAIVFVAGSGPTDRNWCSPLLPGSNGSAKLLAEALAERGYVTLRYDKVASGPRVKENVPKFTGKISLRSHVEELTGAVETLLSEGKVDRQKLFVLTNSEGAIHAVNYQLQAKNNRFTGLVLTGAPGRAIGDVSRTQIYAQTKALSDAEILMKHYDEAIADFVSGRPIGIDPSLPEAMHPFFRALENPTNLPFARELWSYNLADHVSGINEPILVVIGKKDIQIDWKIDGKALENATARNSSASFAYPENANHVLKHEELPLEKITAQYAGMNYNASNAVLDEETASTIYSWLGRQNQTEYAPIFSQR
jgi:uncharacterized protein